MRLLDTHTGQFVEKDPENKETVYAILSHTWDENGEQTYEQLRNIQRRYALPAQTAQDGRLDRPKSSTLSSHKQNTLSSSQPPNRSSEETIERLIQSKMEYLFRDSVQKNDLVIPTPAAASIWHDPELSPKIREACRVAREKGYRYLWIDSCCINKLSSSELSEAINSMYKWYGLAKVCYAYLADVLPGENHRSKLSRFRNSRWFCRGWTLQELIAPLSVEFLSADWAHIGSKHALIDLVESVTKIDEKALLRVEPLDAFSVAQRLSWASNRKTTRVEDRAYSLLGMFDINMPTLYGEGDRAFRRLQEQIMQRTPDQSLFAWGHLYLGPQASQGPLDLTRTPRGHRAILQAKDSLKHLFAISPDYFQGCEGIRNVCHDTGRLSSSNASHRIAYTPTPYGISTQLSMVSLSRDLLLHAIPHSTEDLRLDLSESPEGSQWYLVFLQCELGERRGRFLGRVCYLTSSEGSDVNYVYTGHINLWSQQGTQLGLPNLFLLSPKIIEQYHPHTQLKTVYIPHPDRLNLLSSIQHQSYTSIKLVLLRETCDALRSQGYSADLHHPDPDHPGPGSTTHWLILSKDEHTITIKFQHTLQYAGTLFTIDAEAKISESHVRLDSRGVRVSSAVAPRAKVLPSISRIARLQAMEGMGASRSGREARDETSDQRQLNTPSAPQRYTAHWSNYIIGGWQTKLGRKILTLSAPGAGQLTVAIGLDFGGDGYYILRVDVQVLSNSLPAS